MPELVYPAAAGTVVVDDEGPSRIAVARGMESMCWPSPLADVDGAGVILGFAHPVYGWVYFAVDAASCAVLAKDLTAFATPSQLTGGMTDGCSSGPDARAAGAAGT